MSAVSLALPVYGLGRFVHACHQDCGGADVDGERLAQSGENLFRGRCHGRHPRGNPGDGYIWDGGQNGNGATPVVCPDVHTEYNWTYVIDKRTNVQGYVSSCYVTNP
jgi:hypothetical protein